MLTVAAFWLLSGFMFLTGFLFGKLHERVKWNHLIHKGILPNPMEAQRQKYKR